VITTPELCTHFPAPSGMICTITDTTLNKDSNDVLFVADGALKVPAADVLDIGYGYQGFRSKAERPEGGETL
jgi:hypothetical protein